MDHTLDKTRLTLYYDQYKYRVSLSVPGIQYFRNEKSLDAMNLRFTQEVIARERFPHSFTSNRFGATTHMSNFEFKRVDAVLDESFSGEEVIKEYFTLYEKFVLDAKSKCKVVISINKVTIYTNDETLVNGLKADSVKNKATSHYVETKPDYVKGKIYHKNPKHKLRVYFAPKRLSDKQSVDRFCKFINDNGCRPSYSLQREMRNAYRNRGMIGSPFMFLHSYLYIDVNDEKIITMLALTFGDYVSKVSDIVKR